MKSISKIALLLFMAAAMMFASCNKNYYSGTNKGGKGCGCPGNKGGSGW